MERQHIITSDRSIDLYHSDVDFSFHLNSKTEKISMRPSIIKYGIIRVVVIHPRNQHQPRRPYHTKTTPTTRNNKNEIER